MNKQDLNNRLAVCSWSLQAGGPEELAGKLEECGLNRVQLALDPLRDRNSVWGNAPAVFQREGIEVISGMFGCVGEDYSTLQSIRETGGIAPDATWEQNRKNAQATAALAVHLGLKLVTMHAGFLPHDETDPAFAKMLGRLAEVADIFQTANLLLGLETGQETAPDLLRVLRKLDRPNVGVNFDPANMILYDKGNPVEAVKTLGSWVRQVHIKDAIRTQVPGTWGTEVVAGTGEVDWRAFFAALRELDYGGNLVIEREAGDQRVADIRAAKAMIQKELAGGKPGRSRKTRSKSSKETQEQK